MSSVKKLVDQLKEAIETVNRCSEELSTRHSVYIYLRQLTREPKQGDRIELSDAILHKSVIEKDHDSQQEN